MIKQFIMKLQGLIWIGIEGSSYHEVGDMRGHRDSARIIGNEPALDVESRRSSQMTSGRVRPSTS